MPVAKALWQEMDDAPVFYSPSMLELLEQVQPQKVALAVLYGDRNTPMVALPIFTQGKVQNASYKGWDNLGLLTAKQALRQDCVAFWEKLCMHFSPLQLNGLASRECENIRAARVDCFVDERRKCPYILLGENWDVLNEKLGKKLVRNIRQYGNKAAKMGISFRVATASEFDAKTLKEKLAKAFSFHETRMQDINQKSVFTPAQAQEYHLNVLQNVQNTFVIEAQNEAQETIALYYGLFNKQRLAWFNGGYNTQYYKYSIGTLLVAELISWAYGRGLKVFDFLRGNETYKQRWTSDFDHNCTVFISNNKLASRVQLRQLYFAENRQRVGSKNALRQMLKQTSK